MDNELYSYKVCRANCFCGEFSTIAFKHYYSSKKIYERLLREKHHGDEESKLYKALFNNTSIVCVFSSMAIESFLNDYLAGCLGDKEYYDSFDSLSIINKMNLICKLIFKVDFDKSTELYACLKRLTKDRNDLVHNKSQSFYNTKFFKEHTWTSGNVCEIPNLLEVSTETREKYQQMIEMAKTAIKALVNIAGFFSQRDKNSYTEFRLLGSGVEPLSQNIQSVLKEFGMKF